MKPKIFISYRRKDTAGHAGRLCEALARHFGDQYVFMDIDSIDPGADFPKALERALKSCGAVIVLIGERWLGAKDGKRKIDKPDDYVRAEVLVALKRKTLVIPVLVDDADMPTASELPPDIVTLAQKNAHEISEGRWKHDVGRLIEKLEAELGIRQVAPQSTPTVAFDSVAYAKPGLSGVRIFFGIIFAIITLFFVVVGANHPRSGDATGFLVLGGIVAIPTLLIFFKR